MFEYLWLIPALPFAGFLILALAGGRLPRAASALVGCASIGLSAAVTFAIAWQYMNVPPAGNAFTQTLWTWIPVGNFRPEIAFRLDALSLLMTLVVTFVGFLIHVYSTEYMADDEGFSRFFAYMNLFVGSMLTLILSADLLLMYLGWEGVGLCSYLLIGFWYQDPANGRAARKAFVVTRVGDTAMAVGLFLLYSHLGTLNIQDLMTRAQLHWTVGNPTVVLVAAMLLGGAMGKSAQLPLQTWLPDAMAGPTPVSALIHAATMVTAGVYLIARTNAVFTLAPSVQSVVAAVGAVTLLLAGFTALTQWDLKRVLAYSTISQIGYMFLALGVGAWSAAMFHFMTHAFFKALLFLGAGSVILAMHHEQNMFKMGGLWKKLPLTFWTFLVGSCSLAAVPLVTSGFYSKDMILWQAWSGERGNHWVCIAGLAGAFLTSVYTFRMVFITFFGKAHHEPHKIPGKAIHIPLVILAVLSTLGGFVELPETLGHFTAFSRFMERTLPATAMGHGSHGGEAVFQVVAGLIGLSGIATAYWLFFRKPELARSLAGSTIGSRLHRFWFSGWGFDWVYDMLFVRPLNWAARANRSDFFDVLNAALAALARGLHRAARATQTGKVRWYATGIVIGAIVVIAIVVLK